MNDSNSELVLFEDSGFVNLLPLVYWRWVGNLRCGGRSLAERICTVQKRNKPILYLRPELTAVTSQENVGKVQNSIKPSGRTLFVNARCLLTSPIPETEGNLVARRENQIVYIWAQADLARKLTKEVFFDEAKLDQILAPYPQIDVQYTLIKYPWDLVNSNIRAIEHDWKLLGTPIKDGRIYPGAHLLAPENISIAGGSIIKPGTVLDAESGPIIIGENVTIKSNCTLEGPIYIGDHTLIQPCAVINDGVSIGPVCKVGGELEASIIHSHSNKQHDGFLGHSYIGQWVNLAADTINSDLKNTYGPIRVPLNGRLVDTGQMFVGLTMGDHSKTSVNTMFSTGSVVGFACSVFCSRFVPTFLPSFSWLTDEGRQPAIPEKALEIARQVMARRNVVLTEAMEKLFLGICQQAKQFEIAENGQNASQNECQV